MADVLIYWRDYAANWAYQFAEERAFFWHSSAKCIAELLPGDRMWMVTSGRELSREAEQAAASLVGAAQWLGARIFRQTGSDEQPRL